MHYSIAFKNKTILLRMRDAKSLPQFAFAGVFCQDEKIKMLWRESFFVVLYESFSKNVLSSNF